MRDIFPINSRGNVLIPVRATFIDIASNKSKKRPIALVYDPICLDQILMYRWVVVSGFGATSLKVARTGRRTFPACVLVGK